MINKLFILGLIIIAFGSCATPKYLPSSSKIDVNEYGAYINVKHKNSQNIKGELIAIDSNNITILSQKSNICVQFPISEIKRFKLRFAKSPQYGWLIPILTATTISHGFYSILSAPINLIVTISVNASGQNAFKFSNKNMTFDMMKMYARFPQGIPNGIELSTIK